MPGSGSPKIQQGGKKPLSAEIPRSHENANPLEMNYFKLDTASNRKFSKKVDV